MVSTDESALICDFAETYHVFDWRGLPLKLAATLAAGLREDARIVQIISGAKIDRHTALMAAAVDRLSMLVWAKTKDAPNGRNKPKSILRLLIQDHKEQDELMKFDTAEDFEAARNRILQRGG